MEGKGGMGRRGKGEKGKVRRNVPANKNLRLHPRVTPTVAIWVTEHSVTVDYRDRMLCYPYGNSGRQMD